MALQVFISHTGQPLSFTVAGAPVDSLRSWVESTALIPASRQILMNDRGKIVKNLASETKIYVYDKQFLSPGSKAPTRTDSQIPALAAPPASLTDETSLKAWQHLFMSRRTWGLEAFDIARAAYENVQACADEAAVISRSTKVALDNLRHHVTSLQQRFEETRQWAESYIQEHGEVMKDWESAAATLAELPVREDVAKVLRRAADADGKRSSTIGTLSDLIHRDGLEQAAASVEKSSAQFETRVQDLAAGMQRLAADTNDAETQSSPVPDTDADALLDEAETLAKRISSDYDEVVRTPDNPRSVAAVSRKAALHTRELLPALQSVVEEITVASQSASAARRAASNDWFATLQSISSLQSRLAELQTATTNLDFGDDDSFQVLNRVFQLPVVYGFTLVEATRRSEWTDRTRAEVDLLHEDLSHRTEEEQRRRKKWTASHGEYLNEELNAKDALIDLKASSPRNSWPFVSRDEIMAWIEDLQALGLDDAVKSVRLRFKDLDAAVRKPKSRPFKNGSMHDLTQSASLRPGDETRALQDEKSRVEEKLKAAESRVRKLEDLLHRQSQASRPASGMFVPGSAADFERHSPSPGSANRPGDLSRRSSVSVRRLSNAQDEKLLVQKIVGLEGQVQKLQEEAHAERRSSSESRDKMQEAELVKRDLMANFEAQKQEFEEERQLLDDEVHRLKVRLEEAEDELDRVNESRENLRTEQEDKIAALRTEIDEARATSADDQAEATRRVEAAQKETVAQRERAATLDRQLHQTKDERAAAQSHNVTLAHQLRLMEEQQKEYVAILQGAHSSLSPSGAAPDDLRRLVNALEILSEGAAIHARGLDDSLQLATAENKALEEKVAHGEAQVRLLTTQLATAESRSSDLRERLEQERTKLAALRTELANEHAEMHHLREKFAAGETGSDTLRQQLQSEEAKVAEMANRKAEDEAAIQRLTHEIEGLTRDVQAASQRHDLAKQHLEKRGEKAKQLSERLFHHHDRIIRMLEQFGYSVSRQDETLVIQRASKVNASAVLSGVDVVEPGSSMKRTISGSAPAQHYSDPSDLDTLYWMSDTDLTSESTKYTGFLAALQRLDMDSTIDLITKRYKDVESLAKKYQKDSRAYRERTHRSQAEAHDKIAYRTFKEGDLALFLPTRNQATRPWAAFNVGAPHYFLREQDVHKLQARDWLLARITKVEERVVDLSKSVRGNASTAASVNDDGGSVRSIDDENPFELSDGLRWFMIDAVEERSGAPGTPSVGKSTVTSSHVEVKGHMGLGRKEHKSGLGGGGGSATTNMVTKTLHKSLDSRRSSAGSKASMDLKGKHDAIGLGLGRGGSIKDLSSRATAHAAMAADAGAEPASTRPGDGDHADVHAEATVDHDRDPAAPRKGADPPDGVVRHPTEASQTDREDAQVFEVAGLSAPAVGTAAVATAETRRQALSPEKRAIGSAGTGAAGAPESASSSVPSSLALSKRPTYTSPTPDAPRPSPVRHKTPSSTPLTSPTKNHSTTPSAAARVGGAASPSSSAKPRAWDKLFSMEYRS